MTIRPGDLSLPVYRITMQDDQTFDIYGILDCRQMASLILTDRDGVILRVLAPGAWKEATKIS